MHYTQLSVLERNKMKSKSTQIRLDLERHILRAKTRKLTKNMVSYERLHHARALKKLWNIINETSQPQAAFLDFDGHINFDVLVQGSRVRAYFKDIFTDPFYLSVIDQGQLNL